MKISDADVDKFKAVAEATGEGFGEWESWVDDLYNKVQASWDSTLELATHISTMNPPAVVAWAERDQAQRAEIERLKYWMDVIADMTPSDAHEEATSTAIYALDGRAKGDESA